LLGALIEKKFENKNFLKKGFIKNTLEAVEGKSHEQLLKEIYALKKELL
jgi:hypothetical protein